MLLNSNKENPHLVLNDTNWPGTRKKIYCKEAYTIRPHKQNIMKKSLDNSLICFGIYQVNNMIIVL